MISLTESELLDRREKLTQDRVSRNDLQSIKRFGTVERKKPNGGEEVVHSSPQAIMEAIAALNAESADVLARFRRLL